MPKRISEIASTLKQLGEIQVTDWDFMGLLNKDIRELEIGRSLRRLGRRKVMEWDFRTALPAVHEFVHQEVDVVGWVKRVARYKVMDWDFAAAAADETQATPPAARRTVPGPDEMDSLTARLRGFLQFVAVNLIDEPERAQIRVQELAPGTVRFRLVVTAKDQKQLVGRDGSSAAAIRSLLKATAAAEGAHALLEILSHEEEMTRGVASAG